MHAPISNLNKFLTQILLIQVIHSLSVNMTNRHCILCGLQIPHCFNFIWCYLMQICCVVCLWCVFSFTYVMNFIVIIDLTRGCFLQQGSTLSLFMCLSFGQVNLSFTCPSKKVACLYFFVVNLF
jgi:hypothetical protein